jgi:hypothetical protein
MNSNSFNAMEWLHSNSTLHSKSVKTMTPPVPAMSSTLSQRPSVSPTEALLDFLTPDWKGDGLLSKSAIRVKRLFSLLWADCEDHFSEFNLFTTNLKSSIHQIFLSYMEFENIIMDEFREPTFFYKLMGQRKLNEDPAGILVAKFKNIYSFRITAILLYKYKFIFTLAQKYQKEINENVIFNPNAFLLNTFKKGSSSELNCHALWPNAYSWYRPSQKLRGKLEDLWKDLPILTPNEIMRLTTFSTYAKYQTREESFSHSLSHRTFGQFLNVCFIDLPNWIEQQPASEKPIAGLMTTLFTGDQLAALTQSHWSAQEYDLDEGWKTIICPEFVGQDFSDGLYFKICHELQFLNFLIRVAETYHKDTISFLCSIMKKKYQSSQNAQMAQLSMFQKEQNPALPAFKRVLINLGNLPKKNPHHFLLSQIQGKVEQVEVGGFLFVMTDQNLFLGSQTDKLKQLFKDLRLIGQMNFEELKAKGELGSFLYIFQKRSLQNQSQFDGLVDNFQTTSRESFFTFQISGRLTQFNKFKLINNSLLRFFKEKSIHTPLYQFDVSEDIQLNFIQEAILDGNLVKSSKKEGHITHPIFFKNITRSCQPLENFFVIDSIDPKIQRNTPNEYAFLDLAIRKNEDFPYILIINTSDANSFKLNLIKGENLAAFVNKHGTAYFQYFGLTPKIREMNINIFKDYFESDIGSQIIQLSLNGGISKLKGKLKSLLIPTSFTNCQMPPVSDRKEVEFLTISSEELLTKKPMSIREILKKIKNTLLVLNKDYPWYTLGILSNFKNIIESSMFKINGPIRTERKLLFENPMVMEPLLKLKTYPLYPYNEDVFTEILSLDKADIHQALSKVELKSRDDETYIISLFHHEKLVVQLHSHRDLAEFMTFIYESAINIPISQLLASVQIPRAGALSEVLSHHKNLVSILDDLSTDIKQTFNTLLVDQINN